MVIEQLLKSPGFIYEIGGKSYYIGKWLCKECTEVEATDCVVMYKMCRAGHEEPDTNMYFQRIRAFSDFALEIPYNPVKIREDITALISTMSDAQKESLEEQIQHFAEDSAKYC